MLRLYSSDLSISPVKLLLLKRLLPVLLLGEDENIRKRQRFQLCALDEGLRGRIMFILTAGARSEEQEQSHLVAGAGFHCGKERVGVA